MLMLSDKSFQTQDNYTQLPFTYSKSTIETLKTECAFGFQPPSFKNA